MSQVEIQKIALKQPNIVKSVNWALFYFHVFSKVLYHIFVFPFNVIRLSDNSIIVKTTVLRKIICMTLHIYCGFYIFQFFYDSFIKHRTKKIANDPLLLFRSMAYISSIFAFYCFLHFSWSKTSGYTWLCQQTSNFIHKDQKPRLTDKIIFGIWFILNLIYIIQQWMSTLLSISQQDGAKNIYKHHLYGWHFGDYINPSMDILKYFCSIVASLLNLYIMIVDNIGTSFMGSFVAITVFRVSLDVKEYLNVHPDLDYLEFVNFYLGVRHFMTLVNESTSKVMLSTTMTALAYFSEILTTVFNPEIGFMKLYAYGYYMSLVSISLILAAEAKCNFGNLHAYLFEHRMTRSYRSNRVEHALLLSDSESNPIGLKAFRFFMSYGMLAQIVSTVMTYSVVMLQFSSDTVSDIASDKPM